MHCLLILEFYNALLIICICIQKKHFQIIQNTIPKFENKWSNAGVANSNELVIDHWVCQGCHETYLQIQRKRNNE